MDNAIDRAVEDAYEMIGRGGSRGPRGLALETGGELALSLGYPRRVVERIPDGVVDGFVGMAPVPGYVIGKGGGGRWRGRSVSGGARRTRIGPVRRPEFSSPFQLQGLFELHILILYRS